MNMGQTKARCELIWTHVHISVGTVAIVMKYISIFPFPVIDIHLDKYIEWFHSLFDQVELFHYD